MTKYLALAILLCGCGGEGSPAQEPATTNISVPDKAQEIAESPNPEIDACIAVAELRFTNENGRNLTYSGDNFFTGVACSYHSIGNVFTRTSYVEGIREGIWEVYFINGQLEKEGVVKDGKEDGAYREYFPDGQKKVDHTYLNGTKVGKWLSWYEDGTPYTERNFQNGVLHGKVLVWDELGRLAKEYHYIQGKKINSIMHFKEFE